MNFSTFSWLRRATCAAAVAVLTGGCEMLEFSPSDTRGPDEYTNLTQKNLDKLAARPLAPGDSLRFIFTGDSQRFYDSADKLVESVNRQPGISFLVIAGDISDFGLAREMHWVAERLDRLNVPYLTVVGNHDHVGNGRAAYKKVFGPLNYSFVYGDTKFTFVDTNSREYNFNGRIPDMDWLRPQLSDLQGARRQVVMCHVPPQDGDFDPALDQPYIRSIAEAPQLVFHLNGHRHSYSIGQPFGDGVTYINSGAFDTDSYVILTVWNDAANQPQFRLQRVFF